MKSVRFLFNLVAWVFAAGSALAVYLAGWSVFAAGSFELHRNFSYLFGALTLLLLALAGLGRLPMREIGISLALLFLFLLQSVFVFVWADNPELAALHALNGFAILFLAIVLAWTTGGYLRLRRRLQ
jgi:hypothetical protein